MEFKDPCAKVKKWEHKRPGLNKIKYWAYRLKHKVINKGSEWNPSTSTILSIVKFAKINNCNTVIFGHTHKRYDKSKDGVRIINAGRGKNIYTI